jgi:hypothetical protein
MKTNNELKAIIRKWWEYNQTASQVGEARYFIEQIGDWESGFRSFQTEGWIQPVLDFDIVRCKDVKGGLSLRMESGANILDGILYMSNGVLELKDIPNMNTTGSLVFRGASMSGQ